MSVSELISKKPADASSATTLTAEVSVALIRKVAETQDQGAFSTLFESFAPRIKGYMIRQGANPDLAEELAQEALATVWRKAALYSPDKGNPTTWIYTIARNLRIDRLRRERAWQPLPESHEKQVCDDPTPDEMVSEQQRSQRVREALKELSPEQVQVVTLSFIEGYSHSEIAEHLDIPLGTVKSRMRLAYQKLQPLIADLQ